MKEKILLMLVVAMLVTTQPILWVYAQSEVKTGDFVQLGNYYNEPILWRVINKNDDGTVLLFSEHVLCLKPFDNKESANANYVTICDGVRQYGSSNWERSNLREWLNSEAQSIDNATNPPVQSTEWKSYNECTSEPGFLSCFTPKEKEAIQLVTHKCILPSIDEAYKEGGTESHKMNYYIANIVQNYDKTIYKNVTDRVFLLDVKELHDFVYERGYECGRKPTDNAVDNSKSVVYHSEYCSYWLRTPGGESYSHVRYYKGSREADCAMKQVSENNGVAPALILKTSNICSGTGSITDPFVIEKSIQAKPYEIKYILNPVLEYDEVWPFHEGLARVKIENNIEDILDSDDQYGFVDKEGKTLGPICYSEGFDFSEGLAAVSKPINKKVKTGFINTKGKVVIPFIYDESWGQKIFFSEGLAAVEKGNKTGYIDRLGKQIIPFKFTCGSEFKGGLAPATTNIRYGYIDKKGKFTIKPIYDVAYPFMEGLAMVRVEEIGDFHYIDSKEKTIIDHGYSYRGGFVEGMAVVDKGQVGFIDKAGKQAIPPIYDHAESFSEGLASVMKKTEKAVKSGYDEMYGFVDKTGRVVIPLNYYAVDSFSEGLASVEKDGKFGYIDKKGEVVIPFVYENALKFSEGVAWIKIDNKWGLIANPLKK